MKIYVGNLSYDVVEDELRNLFSEFGEVASVNIVTDKFSGRSKGFGFIEMPARADADNAIAALHGQEFKGRAITVSEARPRPEGGGGGRDNRGGGGGGRRGFGGGGGGGRGGGRDFSRSR